MERAKSGWPGGGRGSFPVVPPETDRLASAVTAAALAVHRSLGPGLLEGIYEECLCAELKEMGLAVQRQVQIPIFYRGIRIGADYRADVVVSGQVLVEVKSVEHVPPVHHAQLLTYLKLSGLRLGLLINFNVPVIRDGIKRMIL